MTAEEEKWREIPPILKQMIQNRDMTKNQKLFIFLEEHGVYEEFYINVYQHRMVDIFNDALLLIDKANSIGRSIGEAFSWGDSPQGFSFWSSLQDIAREQEDSQKYKKACKL